MSAVVALCEPEMILQLSQIIHLHLSEARLLVDQTLPLIERAMVKAMADLTERLTTELTCASICASGARPRRQSGDVTYEEYRRRYKTEWARNNRAKKGKLT